MEDSTPTELSSSLEKGTGMSPNSSIEIPEALLQILLEQRKEEKIVSSIMINPSAIESLAQNAPEALIEFASKSDERQVKYSLEIANLEYRQKQSQENTVRVIVVSIVGMIGMCLTYAAYTGDTNLPYLLATAVITGTGGLGIGRYLEIRRKEED